MSLGSDKKQKSTNRAPEHIPVRYQSSELYNIWAAPSEVYENSEGPVSRSLIRAFADHSKNHWIQ